MGDVYTDMVESDHLDRRVVGLIMRLPSIATPASSPDLDCPVGFCFVLIFLTCGLHRAQFHHIHTKNGRGRNPQWPRVRHNI
jgi:hypothetical protein